MISILAEQGSAGAVKPKLVLGPPEPRLETDLDTFLWQLWWAGCPSPGLMLLVGFSGIPNQVVQVALWLVVVNFKQR